jgi:ferredoxin-like protein FixX
MRLRVKDLIKVINEELDRKGDDHLHVPVDYEDDHEPQVDYEDDSEPNVDYEDPYGKSMMKQCDSPGTGGKSMVSGLFGETDAEQPKPRRAVPPLKKHRAVGMKSLAAQGKPTNKDDKDFIKFKSLANGDNRKVSENEDVPLEESYGLEDELTASCPRCLLGNEGHGMVNCDYRECGECGAELLPDEECENCCGDVDFMPPRGKTQVPTTKPAGRM